MLVSDLVVGSSPIAALDGSCDVGSVLHRVQQNNGAAFNLVQDTEDLCFA
jgi:hypothetical protein